MRTDIPPADHQVSARYYRAVTRRMIPFMDGRPVAVRWRRPGAFTRRVEGGAIRVESARELMDWVKRGVVAFYVSPVTDSGEVWFVITLVAPKLPFDVVRLTALKLLLVLEDTGLDGLLVFDGDEGVGLLWTYGVVDPDDLPGDLWSFQHGVAAALQVRLEKRLAGTPEAGPGGPLAGLRRPRDSYGRCR